MIAFNPIPEAQNRCPSCDRPLTATGWVIAGMHNLARMRCAACSKRFFAVLPTGHGLFYPGLIDESGERYDSFGKNWFLKALQNAWRRRIEQVVTFKTEELRRPTGRRRVLLNALDVCYGHAVYKLFNAQHYLDHEDVDLVVMVQPPLRWLVPDGVSEVWTASIPFRGRNGAEGWNERLAEIIQKEVARANISHLAVTFPQPDKNDYQIDRFTRVRPFPLEEWDRRLDKPTITYIWRSDRWAQPMLASRPFRLAQRLAPQVVVPAAQRVQEAWLAELGRRLRREMPRLDFAVAGIGRGTGGLPSWIRDLRVSGHTDESAKALCERYAESHLVIGTNGSNLLIPGDEAGAVINITPDDWWAVSFGEFPHRITEPTDTMFRYALLPGSTSIKNLVTVATSMLFERSQILLHTARKWTTHGTGRDLREWGACRLQAQRLYAQRRSQ